MARKPLGSEHIRKVTKSGAGSYYVTLPIELVRELKWREHQKVVVEKWGDGVRVKDREK